MAKALRQKIKKQKPPITIYLWWFYDDDYEIWNNNRSQSDEKIITLSLNRNGLFIYRLYCRFWVKLFQQRREKWLLLVDDAKMGPFVFLCEHFCANCNKSRSSFFLCFLLTKSTITIFQFDIFDINWDLRHTSRRRKLKSEVKVKYRKTLFLWLNGTILPCLALLHLELGTWRFGLRFYFMNIFVFGWFKWSARSANCDCLYDYFSKLWNHLDSHNFPILCVCVCFFLHFLYFNVVIYFCETIDGKSAIRMPFSVWSTVSMVFFVASSFSWMEVIGWFIWNWSSSMFIQCKMETFRSKAQFDRFVLTTMERGSERRAHSSQSSYSHSTQYKTIATKTKCRGCCGLWHNMKSSFFFFCLSSFSFCVWWMHHERN